MRALTLVLLGLVSACGANHNSIYRMRPVSVTTATLTTVDAKQRAIIAAPVALPVQAGDAATVAMRFCIEPSPDVFSVLAQSASASGSFGQSADPKSIQAAADFAYSSSEQGSTIPRTQTINMLREAMYRTCERYLNGSISDLEMPIQAVRDQRMMVATLAIEQLTGAVTAKPVVISAGGSASAGGVAQDAAVRVDDAYKALQSADATQRTRQTEYDKLADAEPKCAAIKTKADAGASLTAAETTRQQDCAKAESALAAAKTARSAASGHYDSIRKIAEAGDGVSAATMTGTLANNGGIDRAFDDPVIRVAAAVEHIVDANYAQDEFLLLCLKVFSKSDNVRIENTLIQDIGTTCTNYINSIIKRQQAEADAKSAQFRLAGAEATNALQRLGARRALEDSARTQFDLFWLTVADSLDARRVDPDRLSARIDAFVAAQPRRLARQDLLDRLKTLRSRADLENSFNALPTFMRQGLIG